MLMSPDLFLDCILYLINDTSEPVRRLVRDLIGLYETDSRSNATIDNDVTRFYIRILKAILDTGVSKKNTDELRMILLKFQSDAMLAKRSEIYQLLHDTFMSSEVMTDEKRVLYARRINNVLMTQKGQKAMKSLYSAYGRIGDLISPDDQAAEMRKIPGLAREVGEAFDGNRSHSTKSGSLIEQIDLTDKSSIKAGLIKHQDRAVEGVLRLGLQGLNRILGKRSGLARGESMCIYALPHHYKSGLLQSIAGWVALYNDATSEQILSNKKPLVLFISLENEAYQNLVWMYRHFYMTLNQKTCDHLSDDEVANWTHEAFNEKGYSLVIERHLPSKFNYHAFVETIDKYENSGYEIVLTALDYPNLMAKDGITEESAQRHDLAVRALFSAMCNFTKTKGITFVGAHPLNRKAKELAASGITNVVKRLDTSHLADSFDVTREIDFEIFIHLESNLEGVRYLTMQRGKHRYVDDTPMVHQYCAYRFHPVFGIIDDVLTNPEYVTDIYADPRSQEGTRGAISMPNEGEVEAVSIF